MYVPRLLSGSTTHAFPRSKLTAVASWTLHSPVMQCKVLQQIVTIYDALVLSEINFAHDAKQGLYAHVPFCTVVPYTLLLSA